MLGEVWAGGWVRGEAARWPRLAGDEPRGERRLRTGPRIPEVQWPTRIVYKWFPMEGNYLNFFPCMGDLEMPLPRRDGELHALQRSGASRTDPSSRLDAPAPQGGGRWGMPTREPGTRCVAGAHARAGLAMTREGRCCQGSTGTPGHVPNRAIVDPPTRASSPRARRALGTSARTRSGGTCPRTSWCACATTRGRRGRSGGRRTWRIRSCGRDCPCECLGGLCNLERCPFSIETSFEIGFLWIDDADNHISVEPVM